MPKFIYEIDPWEAWKSWALHLNAKINLTLSVYKKIKRDINIHYLIEDTENEPIVEVYSSLLILVQRFATLL